MAKETKTVEINSHEEMIALIKRVDKNKPNPEDLEALSKEMDKNPEPFSGFGNVQKHVFGRVLDAVITSRFQKECTLRYIEEMKSGMGYHTSTFVEKMLIDEIVMRWLRLQSAEASYQSQIIDKTHTLEAGIYHEKLVEQAQRRYIRAMETLAKVRKMIGQTQASGAKMFKDLMKAD